MTAYALMLVGCGKMGGAMLRGWLAQGVAAQTVAVVDPVAEVPTGVTRFARSEDLPPETSADVVVLAVKPQMMEQTLPAYRALAASGRTLFLSVAAGKTISYFQDRLSAGSGVPVVRAMPNTPAAIGQGMTVLTAGAGVSAAQRATCQKLMEATGQVAWLEDEALMDAVTAVSGSGPAYVFHLVEAMAQAGAAMGLPEDLALMLARQTVVGSGALLQQSPESAAQLRQNVTSPGGTTAAALGVLMEPTAGLPPLMEKAIQAAVQRGKELAAG